MILRSPSARELLWSIRDRLERIDRRFESIVADNHKLDTPATNRKLEVLAFLKEKRFEWNATPAATSFFEYLTDKLLARDPHVLKGGR